MYKILQEAEIQTKQNIIELMGIEKIRNSKKKSKKWWTDQLRIIKEEMNNYYKNFINKRKKRENYENDKNYIHQLNQTSDLFKK